jgi:hypothetical protein
MTPDPAHAPRPRGGLHVEDFVVGAVNGYDVHPGERSGFEARVSRPSTPPRLAEHIIT